MQLFDLLTCRAEPATPMGAISKQHNWGNQATILNFNEDFIFHSLSRAEEKHKLRLRERRRAKDSTTVPKQWPWSSDVKNHIYCMFTKDVPNNWNDSSSDPDKRTKCSLHLLEDYNTFTRHQVTKRNFVNNHFRTNHSPNFHPSKSFQLFFFFFFKYNNQNDNTKQKCEPSGLCDRLESNKNTFWQVMLIYPNKWHRGSGYGSLEEGFNVAQCQATVTAALNHACCIRCSLLCVAHYVTKHKCVFPLMRTEVELLGHPRRTWLGQQTIRSGASSKDWTEVAAALKTAARKIRFQEMCWT